MDEQGMAQKIAELEARVAEEQQARRAAEEELAILRAAFEVMPLGLVLIDAGVARVNQAAKNLFHGPPLEGELLLPDGHTPLPRDRVPLERALGGEDVDGVEHLIRPSPEHERETWISSSARPLRGPDGDSRGALWVIRDVTEHKEILRDLDEAVIASDAEKRELIAALEAGIKTLSTPIIEVWDDVLALPVIGAVDEKRGAEITARLLDEIVSRGSRFVIIDWTGVDEIDAASAQHLQDLVRAVSLVGAECILTGIRPAVAGSLVEQGVQFEPMRLLRTVKHGIRHCLSRLGRR